MGELSLLEAMERYRQEGVYPFHTPGHKGGRGVSPGLARLLGPALALDVSLMQELDDIHSPSSYLAAGQALAAELYGAAAAFYAPNGTTQAVEAMLLGALEPGDKLLLPRNAHRSVAAGLILAGLEPSYLLPAYRQDLALVTQVEAEAVAAALARDKAIKGVLVTSPSYYGLAADLPAIAASCHAQGALLLVDEAHGAHLGFSPQLPPSALACGADASAQSSHKLLPALTQASLLLVQGERLEVARMAAAMSLLGSTSPNYYLLASLDEALRQMASQGRALVEAALAAAAQLRSLLAELPGLRLLTEAEAAPFPLDPTKVTVNCASLGYTGPEVAAALRRQRVAVELADRENVLFLVTGADQGPDYQAALGRLARVFQELAAEARPPLAGCGAAGQLPLPEVGATPREAFFAPQERLPFREAVGRLSGEQVGFYPPGIPVLLPGERLSPQVAAYCQEQLRLGLTVSGPSDASLATLRVLK